ncbi:CvpA family protein [Microvirga sp. W0021]|uniref:CvpA family protein n=1 Tax=Hohaiivirga grylli TaxID=3133970 RepID=A0ABV0BKA7_9HYPH
MPISVLDIVVIGVTLISAVLAAVRGFSREVLGIAAWVIAAAAAWFLFPAILPFTKQYVSHDTIALAITIAGIFIVTLLLMSLITVQISDLVLDSRIGAVDRTLGLVFGIVRGFLICVIAWLLFSLLLQGKVPDWAESAKTRPLLDSTSATISNMFKANTEGLADKFFKKPADSGSEPPPEPAQTQQENVEPSSQPDGSAGQQ